MPSWEFNPQALNSQVHVVPRNGTGLRERAVLRNFSLLAFTLSAGPVLGVYVEAGGGHEAGVIFGDFLRNKNPVRRQRAVLGGGESGRPDESGGARQN